MIKLYFIIISSFTLISCGGGGGKKQETINENKLENRYSILIEAIYEQNDSIAVIYKTPAGFQYEKPVSKIIAGTKDMQSIVIYIPEGIDAENFQITFSTNTKQKTLTIKNISISNQELIIFNGNNLNYVTFFDANPGFIWNQKDLSYILNFKGQFPPGMTGNKKLESILVK